MIGGLKFSLRMEGIKARVFTNKKIKKQHVELPKLEFNLDILAVHAGISD
jgi:hypothetical protein